MSRPLARLLCILATACGALMLTPSLAQAQLVDHSREHIVGTFELDLCGQDIVGTVDLIAIQQQRLGRNGFPLFKGIFNGTQTYTNPDTGTSLNVRLAGLGYKDLSVTDNGDGTITVRSATTGLQEQLRLPDGTLVSMDVGRLVIALVLDYNGTPAIEEDDTLISEELIFQAGPHPDLDSGFELFCDFLTA